MMSHSKKVSAFSVFKGRKVMSFVERAESLNPDRHKNLAYIIALIMLIELILRTFIKIQKLYAYMLILFVGNVTV